MTGERGAAACVCATIISNKCRNIMSMNKRIIALSTKDNTLQFRITTLWQNALYGKIMPGKKPHKSLKFLFPVVNAAESHI